MPDSTVRVATKADLPWLKEIVDLSFPIFYRFFAWHSLNEPEEPVLVAQSNETVAGFAKLTEFTVGQVKCGCILWIAVHPKFRHRGTASTLTNASVKYLGQKGATLIFASTQRRNKGAQATLARDGFSRIGFLALWRLFRWRVFDFYRKIWFAPGEIVFYTHIDS